MKKNRLILFVSALLMAAPVSMNAQPNQQGWRGANRDGVYPGDGMMQKWPEAGLTELWSADNAGKGYSSPVGANNHIYITGLNEAGDKEVFSAYTMDGKRVYQVEYGNNWKASFEFARTTPTIVGDKAYVITGMGEVACINTTDGKIVWFRDAGKEYEMVQGTWGTSESPIVADGKVIYTPTGKKAYMVALDAATGKTVWTTPPIEGEKGAFVNPLLINHNGRKQIVTCTAVHMVGVDLETGKLAWTFTDWLIDPASDRRNPCNTPIYYDGKIFMSQGYDLGACLVELNNDASAVKLLWKNEDLDTHIGHVVLHKGTLYGASWIGNNNGNWVAVDWKTGKTLYNTQWPGHIKGNVILVGDKIIAYEERRGELALMNPTPEKFDLISSFRITKGDGPHWAHPTVHNGVLYLRHGATLMAFSLK